MIDVSAIQEIANQAQEKTQEAKALTAKIKGLNGYLTSLLQKKVRIDIEIRRTKNRLSKLRTRSSTVVKTAVRLEDVQGLAAASALSETASGTGLPAATFDDLTSALNESESLILEVEQLPLVEDK